MPTPAPTTPVARPTSSGSIPVGGFTPGTILADRYRVVGLVGRGGMGEVYRADDLKLGQAVALKFLPKALSNDPVRRERFFAEVRITRQLSHPNICRVYDIAEFDGQHFLSMEFIDGEDLASLIRRIGYLTNEKALDIARQLMAGLSTAHEKGVLHRDLKPANIMIDGHGRVRITDFGIAIAMEDETQNAEISGTPAYMAPEQLAGKGATVRSDIYSLGLILYELCSGKKAFTAGTLAELREQKEGHTPRALSDIRSSVDPILERIITRCIDRDPRGRPASVSQLAASLPGGDPLAAAIAAGQTPSPEMVAASGLKEGLRPAVGVTLLAIIVVGLLIVAATGSRDRVFMRMPSGKSPEVLAEKGREFLRNAGYTNAGVDRAMGYTFIFSPADLSSELGTDKGREQWDKVEAESLRFWYRESPEPLTHWRDDNYVAPGDPPMFTAEGVRIQLTADGRLRELTVTPTRDDSADRSAAPNWSSLFSEAGLNETDFTPSATASNPFFYGDTRAAWDETMPQAPEIRMRIEAAAYQGKPVYFSVMWPWSQTDARFSRPLSGGTQLAGGGLGFLIAGVSAGALFLVRRNMRLGRGDRRGAAKLALLFLALQTVAWILSEHHVAAITESRLLRSFAGQALLLASFIWLLYLAVEPIIRRRWPESLISWSRLLSGEWRDPLVGRDVLVGCAMAFLAGGFLRSVVWTVGGSPLEVIPRIPLGIMGPSFLVAWLAESLGNATAIALGLMVTFFLLRWLLRKDWIVASVIALTMASLLLFSLSGLDRAGIAGITVWLSLSAFLFLYLSGRFGLLAVTAFVYSVGIIIASPMTLDTSAWYFRTGLATFLFVVVLSFVAFRISLGGQRLLKEVED